MNFRSSFILSIIINNAQTLLDDVRSEAQLSDAFCRSCSSLSLSPFHSLMHCPAQVEELPKYLQREFDD